MSSSNRLIHEKSPYLLQHARNPVDWYPWGEEAFERARRENKPVFLSVGYSTCHWCHVMAHESFESQDVADVLNRDFISIKVDREERPDIDHIYMTAVTSMTGQGGWPLSAFLTPDKHPFFGGTYFPPYPRWGTPGFLQVLDSILRTWNNQNDQVKESAAGITEVLSRREGSFQDAELSNETLDQGFLQLASRYDSKHGGFGQAPKFPSAHQLMFLMRYWHRSQKEEALQMSLETLKHMALGGIYDHLGGGFHRYATDRQWQIPHFEKMLYDQAMISRAFLEAYQVTKDEIFAAAARETFDYVLRDLTSPLGGFFSAEDADSVDPDDADPHEKKEGAFYLWRQTEIMDVLGQDDALVFNTHYQINQDGNAHSDPHGDFEGKNIIFAVDTLEATAEKTGRTLEEIRTILQRSKDKLLATRSKRARPHLDDKVLADWNGLMIASLAFGVRILKDEKYLQAAVKAADFILKTMTTSDGKLLHRWRDGEAGINAGLEDYAYCVYGLLEIYQATLDVHYLSKAKSLTDEMIRLFTDDVSGGFYLSSKETADLPFRPKNIYDGALPSGNSIAAGNLLRLYRITFENSYRECARKLFKAFAEDVRQVPMGYAQLLSSLMWALGPSKEIVVASGAEGLSVDEILDELTQRFLPDSVVVGDSRNVFPSKALAALSPWTENQKPVNGRTTVYVCNNQSCQKPVTDILGIAQLLA